MTSGLPSSPSYFGLEIIWSVSIIIAWNKVVIRFWLEFSFVFSFIFWNFNVSCIKYFYTHMCAFTCMHVCLSTNFINIISIEWGALENTQV